MTIRIGRVDFLPSVSLLIFLMIVELYFVYSVHI